MSRALEKIYRTFSTVILSRVVCHIYIINIINPIEWNLNFSNLLGGTSEIGSRLIRRFEKLGVELQCLTGEGEGKSVLRPSKGVGHVALSHSFMHQCRLTNRSKCRCRSIKCAQMSLSLQVFCVCL